MKIIFICGSIEPGRDGVGDYTRRLAGELLQQRQQVGVLALYDPFLQEVLETNSIEEEKDFNILRLGNGLTQKERFTKAKNWIDRCDPEWLSLQYVPFSFHKKGLPWSLGHKLANLGKGRKWHIMFHELWVGMNKSAGYKKILWGKVQQLIINNMIVSLSPDLLTTQTSIYKTQLEKLGFDAKILPLFGNIKMERVRKNLANNTINIAVFGWIHTGAKLKNFIHWLSVHNRLHYQFHFLGGSGKEIENWIRLLKENGITYKVHGWLPEEEISTTLFNCQWSVTSTPYNLVEKSGTVAAMLEHDLTVFCIGSEWEPRGLEIKNLVKHTKVVNWEDVLDPKVFEINKKQNFHNRLNFVANSFLKEIKAI